MPWNALYGAYSTRFYFLCNWSSGKSGFKKTKSGVCLVHQVIERLSKRWRRLCSAHLCGTLPLPGRKENEAVHAA